MPRSKLTNLVQSVARLADGLLRTPIHPRLLLQSVIKPSPEVLDILAKAQAP